MGPKPPPVPKPAPSPSPDEAPKKRRRTLRDAESELESCRLALRESKRMLYTTAEEGESEESSLWSNDFQPDAADGDGLLEPISQLSQASHWSELSSTSNLEAVISFLDSHGQSQDASESARYILKRELLATLQSENAKLKTQQTVVRVGVGVLLMSKKHPNCVLIGQRKGSHGAGKFALPGGHLEMYESWQECAIREVKEETDLDLTEAKLAFREVSESEPCSISIYWFAAAASTEKHYITILMQAVVDDEQPVRNMEPNKCVGWTWERWSDLRARDDMFTPLLHVTRSNFRPKFLLADDEESDQD
ncbi:hypothetical protein BBJ28_00023698 [Nothophytophthora sp. Chile5]|nr:hypothetical protein BBJ28_00023698 [Nothophytophthora sp. Chile5]